MVFTFTVDKYLNPYVPSSIVRRLPPYLGRWLGQPHSLSKTAKPDYVLWIDIMIGTFCGLLTLMGIFKHSSVFISHHSPILIASYGATAILLFNVNQTPLGQPRNIIMGHFLSALTGVIILKLFQLSDAGKDHLYVGAALSTAIASIVMTVFNCVHPPSGATALIPLIDDNIAKMGWWYLPVHLVSSVVIVGVGLITNNVLRSYPVYFWTAYVKEPPKVDDIEKGEDNSATECDEKKSMATAVVISLDQLIIPEGLVLKEAEVEQLRRLQAKLKECTGSTS